MKIGVIAVLIAGGGVGPGQASASDAAGVACYTVGDADPREHETESEEFLVLLGPDAQDERTREVRIGTGTGRTDIESLAFEPNAGLLFGVDGGVLGTLHLATGVFTAVGDGIGEGSGPFGVLGLDKIQGLAFDPATGVLYASHRRTGADLLLRVDPLTGRLATGAFGESAGEPADYAVLRLPDTIADLDDIDALAFPPDAASSPTDRRMYAVANDDGAGDHLVTIDPASGAITDIGPIGAADVEGLDFTGDGRLIGTTGGVGGHPSLFDIDPATGRASNPRTLSNLTDYEGVACLPAAEEPPPPPPPPPPPVVETAPPPAEPPAEPPRVLQSVPTPEPPTVALAGEPAELPRTGPLRGRTVLGGLLLVAGGFSIAIAAPRRRRRRSGLA